MVSLFDFSKKIKDLKQESKYEEAINYFKEEYKGFNKDDLVNNGYAVGYILTCLRKIGKIDSGFKLLKSLGIDIDESTNPQIKNSFAWLLYFKLKDIKDESEFNKLRDEIVKFLPLLDLSSDYGYIPFSLLFSRILKLEKQKKNPNWIFISDFLDQIDPLKLSVECKIRKFEEGGLEKEKEMASDKELWYMFKTKALESLKQYQKCLDACNDALNRIEKFHYDNDIWFKRRIAISKRHLGQKEGAIAELITLLAKRKEWFIELDIANFLFEDKRYEEALVYASSAALSFQDPEKKIRLYLLLAKIYEVLGKNEVAKKHVVYALRVAEKGGLKDIVELNNLKKVHNVKIEAEASEDEVLKQLKHIWKDVKLNNLPELHGKIKTVKADFGFIAGDDNQDYYFKFNEFKDKKQRIEEGFRVKFYLEKSFDRKKNKDSFRAVNILVE